MTDTLAQFRQAITATGIEAPDVIEDDGALHRFSPTGRGTDKAAWYVLHTDGIAAGAFGDWRSGFQSSWCAKSDSAMTPAELADHRQRIKAMQAQREAELLAVQLQASQSAAALWAQADAVAGQDHPYLVRKGVQSHGLKAFDDKLLIPMRDTAGKLHSLQAIDEDGTKRFHPGGRVKGCYFAIGRPAGRIIVCEGYATGASLHEATDEAVAVTFNAGNQLAVATALQAKHPQLQIIMAATHAGSAAVRAGRLARQQGHQHRSHGAGRAGPGAAGAGRQEKSNPDQSGAAGGSRTMSFADLIKKGSLRQFATATSATAATHGQESGLSVATVAVAKAQRQAANDPAQALGLVAARAVASLVTPLQLVSSAAVFTPVSIEPAAMDDPDRWCWPYSTAMTGREIDAMAERTALFNRRGLSALDAELLADKLVTRDREADERRLCLECAHLSGRTGAGRCSQWQAAGLVAPGLPAGMAVLLQRCGGFSPAV